MTSLDQIGQCALSSRETLQATYDAAVAVLRNRIPGDFVECGVFAGAQIGAMAKAIIEAGENDRRIHLFDSFEGIPLAGEFDLEFLAAKHPHGLSACSMEDVKHNLRAWGVPDHLLVFHPGWFADTIPNLPPYQIALLRLDGDLYESTKVCMEYLYPRLSVGGWLIVDDYHLSGCRKAVDETAALGPIYYVRQ